MSNSNDPSPTEATTHFGFRTVREEEKASLVRAVFDGVATRYDLMNDVMSVGIHRFWKDNLIDWLRPRAGMSLLDVGGGTGDIAFRFRARGGGPVTVCDINREMLSVGRDRAIDRNCQDDVSWVCGDAERLPFPDRSVDAYTIAFCLRNVTRIDLALAEARRVLKPGGRFLCLEFSQVVLPALRGLYDRYSFEVLPRIGAMVAGNRDAYQYLVESIRKFPPQAELAGRMAQAGFEQVHYRNLSGGIAALHSGWRL
ncbi:bifunctional demethylmenaquinone methyltransferase/2-methoxy-6-polyprenyl-1,4-benzoquinol methylase UbiE [Telmatospirillum siberiense]|uniref:Ubiquinone/menaquinone biosynthesis C-methyltransferase UbiE n=1 Tax=Telmatospirillum siberiense TaxID=382514 RepID=A0A2N3PSL5_9PROT|nr:bifunctional demethylmenaquinone methyltransferase/2-methoxy-6-polyprenyl-1,4-benzoquinol methylase UbiE [Telmatospirillum siberiense]PKU23392.1 bifunctional demethylmenaquinone methyltransferase/2-methoxy-6-polyprenyl-1,4-benzoquinol methylase UbiE [Telmatospirillum siberiense]